uniref:Uncharacterized protein n=1 Tax=Triticum urartu TaxID=4572 RepID=A0A8R7PFL9_TRIUA
MCIIPIIVCGGAAPFVAAWSAGGGGIGITPMPPASPFMSLIAGCFLGS